MTRSSNKSSDGISAASSDLPSGIVPFAKKSSSASNRAILFFKDISILRYSIPSVYSPILGNGITTSSLILKALVCFEIAAVLALSSQNFFRDSGEIATKPSPTLWLAIRITSLAALATKFASSPTISPIKTILGNTLRLDLVEYPTAFKYFSSKCSRPARIAPPCLVCWSK